MKYLALFLIIVFHATQPVHTAHAQEISVQDSGSASIFGEKIIFRVRIEPAAGIDEILVAYTPDAQNRQLEKMILAANGEASLEVAVNPTDIKANSISLQLAPFTQIKYHFEVRLVDGKIISSPDYQLVYDDTRFTWQTLEDGIFQVHWNSDDTTQGQEIINLAGSGLEYAQTYLDVELPTPLRIYAYSSSTDLQEALMTAGKSWTAGHASPDLGMILISIPTGPEKNLELQRQIPHEIMHLLQYQVTGNSFMRQPMWLLEGMASIAESYPNPEYRRVLEDTTRSDNFIPMDSICTSFPDEAGAAFRAYAQSESFVRFLYSVYGTSGIRNLMEQYQNGLSCTEGVSAAFGVTLGQLEYRWKQEVLGLNAGGLALRRLAPYLVVGLILLIPAVLSFLPLVDQKRKPKRSAPNSDNAQPDGGKP